MKIIKASNFVGQTDYFWVNAVDELPLNFRKNYFEVNQIDLDLYVDKIKELSWFKLDLDTWDRVSLGKSFSQIDNYVCSVLALEEYDKVGLMKNTFQALKRMEDLCYKINLP